MLLLGCMSIMVSGMSQVTMATFLKSALQDVGVHNYEAQQVFLTDHAYGIPVVSRLQARVQANELDTRQAEYGLRATVANPWQIKYNNRYFDTYKASLDLQQEQALKEALSMRYDLLISYTYLLALSGMHEQQMALLQDRIEMLAARRGASSFTADDYVSLQVKYAEIITEQAAVRKALTTVRMELQTVYGMPFQDSMNWSAEQLISTDQIVQRCATLDSAATSPLAVRYQQQRLALDQQAYKLEKVGSSLGFIQTEYDQNSHTKGRTPVNLSLGINIPLVNDQKPDMARKQLKSIEAEHAIRQADDQQTTAQVLTEESLKQLLAQYADLQGEIKRLEDDDVYTLLSGYDGGNLLLLWEYYDQLLKLKFMLLEIRTDIRRAYIKHLYLHDILQVQPLLNYLDPAWAPL